MVKRISALNTLARCPSFAMIDSLRDRGSGKAADTATCVGRVIQLWHEQGEHAEALQAAMLQAEREIDAHPLADFDEVRKMATGYAADPRNVGVVDVESCEKEVYLTLGDHKLTGHVDQLRRVHGALSVCDVKSGKPGGRDMVHSYAWQLAAYALACTETLGELVLPGGIIRVRAYMWNTRCKWDKADMSTCPAFYPTPWTHAHAWEMMESAKFHLDLLSSGSVLQQPGGHCNYCPGGGPATCGDVLSDAYEDAK